MWKQKSKELTIKKQMVASFKLNKYKQNSEKSLMHLKQSYIV